MVSSLPTLAAADRARAPEDVVLCVFSFIGSQRGHSCDVIASKGGNTGGFCSQAHWPEDVGQTRKKRKIDTTKAVASVDSFVSDIGC